MSRFTDTLLVSPLADGKTWILRKEFGYDVGAKGSEDQVNVPALFMTDFASVPRLLWAVLPRWGRYGNAAVIHDFCYWAQERTRAEAFAGIVPAGRRGGIHRHVGRAGLEHSEHRRDRVGRFPQANTDPIAG